MARALGPALFGFHVPAGFREFDDLRQDRLLASRNIGGRRHALAHYVLAPACNCLREFIFYSSADYACYNFDTSSQGSEVLVRRWLDGPPNQ